MKFPNKAAIKRKRGIRGHIARRRPDSREAKGRQRTLHLGRAQLVHLGTLAIQHLTGDWMRQSYSHLCVKLACEVAKTDQGRLR